MKKEAPPEVPVVENLHAPEFFVAGALGSFVHQGNIHLTLASPRGIHGAHPGVAHVASLRIVMSLANAEAFATYVQEQVNRQLDQQIPLPPGIVKH
jgi:hypothetical protein